jgi:uncharacterized repeat protein (TIGR01451 family)
VTVAIRTIALLVLGFVVGLYPCTAEGEDLTIPGGGKISIELLSSNAQFRNTLSLVQPAGAGIASTGCKLEPAVGLGGVHALSEKLSQHGCRVTLDADMATAGIQGFAANTVLRFGMCAQTDADADCEFVWSSNPGSNADGKDHVQTTPINAAAFPDQIFRLNWEDLNDLGDNDFDDLIVVVRADLDADGDGLWDDWERFGIDTDGNGSTDLNLPALGANWRHKDVFVEVDWMDCTLTGSDCPSGDTHNHQPNAGAITAVINSFAAANVTNPDGVQGITLHVDVSNSFPHQNFLVIPNACFGAAAGTGFDAVKNDAANFGPNNPRRFAYHYALFTHRQTSTDQGSSGCGELPGNDFQVSLGAWSGQTGTLMDQAGTFMHELGHNLNLRHGGGDNTNFKPNYLSIMSYTYQVSGIPPTDPDGGGPLTARMDYSRSALPALNEGSLNEQLGIQDGTDNVFFTCPGGGSGTGAGNAGINWDCDGTPNEASVAVDVNNDGVQTALNGFQDWANIKYDFQLTGDFDDGAHTPLPFPEIDFETFQEVVSPELSVSLAAAPSVVVTGSNVVYTITVANNRPGAAANVIVTDTLSADVTFVSCASTLNGVCGGVGNSRTVQFASLAGGASATITIVGTINCPVVDDTVVHNFVSVTFDGTDPDPGNNSASVTVTAENPPPAISGESVNMPSLWPANHKMVDVTVSYNVTDNCGTPACTLTVTSSEPVDGLGDGDTAPDWEIVDRHHVRLRAERGGGGTGRVYTITITCMDSSGASSSKTVAVVVPHSKR